MTSAATWGSLRKVSIMEFGLKGTSLVCRGRHREVGIVEFELYQLCAVRSIVMWSGML